MPKAKDKITVVNRKLGKHKAYGLAYTDSNEIHLDTRMGAKKHLNISVHEALHVIFPDWSENKVTQTANKISKFLWEQNYRKVINK